MEAGEGTLLNWEYGDATTGHWQMEHYWCWCIGYYLSGGPYSGQLVLLHAHYTLFNRNTNNTESIELSSNACLSLLSSCLGWRINSYMMRLQQIDSAIGPHVDAWNVRPPFLGGSHTVALSSGTAALHLVCF